MNKRITITLAMNILVATFLAMILVPLSVEAQAGVASASPMTITVGIPVDVTMTIQLTDARLIPNSVNLQRLDANGKVIAVLGNLNDSGINGDAVAGDQLFSLRHAFTETAITSVQLRISWALKGVLKRAVSNVMTIQAVNFPPNPVAASEKDMTLAGADADNNGVRDDVDAFIVSRYTDAQQRAVATTYASAMTKMMLATEPSSSYVADQLVGAAQVCAWNMWGLRKGQRELTEIKAALLNNQQRMGAYLASDKNLGGKILQGSDLICPIDGKTDNLIP